MGEEQRENQPFKPAKCSSLRKNGYVLLNNDQNPCKIVSMTTSKTGKHGGAKINMVGIDIFTGRKFEEICMSQANMNVPDVDRYDCQLIEIESMTLDNGKEMKSCSMLDDNAIPRAPLTLPDDEIGQAIEAAFAEGKNVLVTIMKAMNHEQIMGHKIVNDE